MFIFDHYRLILGYWTIFDIFGFQHVQYPILRQRITIKQREMFCWKALVISFLKINKSFYKNNSIKGTLFNFFKYIL
jgi:hypothetical protein